MQGSYRSRPLAVVTKFESREENKLSPRRIWESQGVGLQGVLGSGIWMWSLLTGSLAKGPVGFAHPFSPCFPIPFPPVFPSLFPLFSHPWQGGLGR